MKMSKTTRARTYGKSSKRSKAQRLFVELAQSPIRPPPTTTFQQEDDPVSFLSEKLDSVHIIAETAAPAKARRSPRKSKAATEHVTEEEVSKPIECTPAEPPAQLHSPPAPQASPESQQPNDLVDLGGGGFCDFLDTVARRANVVPGKNTQ